MSAVLRRSYAEVAHLPAARGVCSRPPNVRLIANQPDERVLEGRPVISDTEHPDVLSDPAQRRTIALDQPALDVAAYV